MKHILTWSLCIVMVLSCNDNKPNKPNPSTQKDAEKLSFELIPAEESGIKFVNNLTQTEEQNIFDDIYFFNGSGVAVGDVNNDGLPDLYFGGNQSSNRLYINKGKFKFEDVTESAGVSTNGWTTGVAMVDINNDGLLDIYVCRTSPYVSDEDRSNLLFVNQGGGKFEEQASYYGLDNKGYSTQASFFDADNDGDLDMYLANRPLMYKGIYREFYKKYRFTDELGTHRMFINENGKFKDISENAGVLCNGYGLSANLADINSDGITDIYVCNDFIYPDFLYYGNGDGTFTDRANEMMKHTSLSSMGSDLADINNDGYIDLFTVDMLAEGNDRKKVNSNEDDYDKYMRIYKNGYGHQLMRNNLQLNLENKTFIDIGFMAGVAETDWSWAPLFADFDNDGNKDLFVSNGYYKDFNNQDFMKFRNENQLTNNGEQESMLKLLANMPETRIQNYIFKNNGDLSFEKKSDEWGLKEESFSQGAAYADLDNDGDLDLIVSNLGEYPYVYKNTLDDKNYLKIEFKGDQTNKSGIGCKVWIKSGNKQQYYEHYPTRGFQSTVEPIVHVGVGSAAKIDELTVWWPASGKAEVKKGLEKGQTIVLNEKDANIDDFQINRMTNNSKPEMLVEQSIPGLDFKHKESTFVDFRNEPLIPHMMSRFGPGLAVGDVNGDGLDDVFFGGGARVLRSALYTQTSSGSFALIGAQPWGENINSEFVDAAFFDCDKDGDQDLIAISGGNEFPNMGQNYAPVLYENLGDGTFRVKENSLPNIQTPNLSVSIGDIDNDGDLDMFIGGTTIPRGYPVPTGSFLLENDGKGVFKDVTKNWHSNLETPGIINEAQLVDVNMDGLLDLVFAGYWTNVSVYINDGTKFIDQTVAMGLDKTEGWWNALEVKDIDNDGDMDLILGNEGNNNLMRVSPSRPSYIVRGDMNKNGALDAVCFYTIQGKRVPLHSYPEIIQQLSGLIQKRYPKVAMYANATMENMFTPAELEGSKTYTLRMFSSGVFVNDKGKFSFKPFPKLAQVSNINDFLFTDINKDGREEMLVVGNSDAPRISLGRNDALNGLVMSYNAGQWEMMSSNLTGFWAPLNAQRVERLKTAKGDFILVANNNDAIQTFKVNTSAN